MKALLLAAIILGGAIGSSVAQKKSTFMGDIVVGELTGRDEATREITVKYLGKEGPEIFSGFLVDGYKLKMNDSRSDLSSVKSQAGASPLPDLLLFLGAWGNNKSGRGACPRSPNGKLQNWPALVRGS